MTRSVQVISMRTWGELGNLLAGRTLAATLAAGLDDAEVTVVEAETLFPQFAEAGAAIRELVAARLPADEVWAGYPAPHDGLHRPATGGPGRRPAARGDRRSAGTRRRPLRPDETGPGDRHQGGDLPAEPRRAADRGPADPGGQLRDQRGAAAAAGAPGAPPAGPPGAVRPGQGLSRPRARLPARAGRAGRPVARPGPGRTGLRGRRRRHRGRRRRRCRRSGVDGGRHPDPDPVQPGRPGVSRRPGADRPRTSPRRRWSSSRTTTRRWPPRRPNC